MSVSVKWTPTSWRRWSINSELEAGLGGFGRRCRGPFYFCSCIAFGSSLEEVKDLVIARALSAFMFT